MFIWFDIGKQSANSTKSLFTEARPGISWLSSAIRRKSAFQYEYTSQLIHRIMFKYNFRSEPHKLFDSIIQATLFHKSHEHQFVA